MNRLNLRSGKLKVHINVVNAIGSPPNWSGAFEAEKRWSSYRKRDFSFIQVNVFALWYYYI